MFLVGIEHRVSGVPALKSIDQLISREDMADSKDWRSKPYACSMALLPGLSVLSILFSLLEFNSDSEFLSLLSGREFHCFSPGSPHPDASKPRAPHLFSVLSKGCHMCEALIPLGHRFWAPVLGATHGF